MHAGPNLSASWQLGSLLPHRIQNGQSATYYASPASLHVGCELPRAIRFGGFEYTDWTYLLPNMKKPEQSLTDSGQLLPQTALSTLASDYALGYGVLMQP